MSNIISTNGTPLTNNVTRTQGGYTALGTLGGKSVVLTSLNMAVVKLSPSELKEMNLKALCGAEWCTQHYERFDEKKKTDGF